MEDKDRCSNPSPLFQAWVKQSREDNNFIGFKCWRSVAKALWKDVLDVEKRPIMQKVLRNQNKDVFAAKIH